MQMAALKPKNTRSAKAVVAKTFVKHPAFFCLTCCLLSPFCFLFLTIRYGIPPMLTSIPNKQKIISETKRPPKWSTGVSSILDDKKSRSTLKIVLFLMFIATNYTKR